MPQLLLHPIVPLVLFSLVTAAMLCAYTLAGEALSPETDTLVAFSWVVLMLMWMEADARRLRHVPCYDFGLLAWVTFPLSTAWYCFWSRGWRGLLLVFVLLALYFGPWLAASVVWGIKWGDG